MKRQYVFMLDVVSANRKEAHKIYEQQRFDLKGIHRSDDKRLTNFNSSSKHNFMQFIYSLISNDMQVKIYPAIDVTGITMKEINKNL